MARLVFTTAARRDVVEILTMLAANAGAVTAFEYAEAFGRLYNRLEIYPEAYPSRSSLGSRVRAGVVSPYVVLYRHDREADTVTILRLIHGRRKITSDILGKS